MTDVAALTKRIETESGFLREVLAEVETSIVGQRELLDGMLIGMLADGHVLIEGVPGLAKSMAAQALAGAIGGTFRRIQFTPDLLPSDLTGTQVYDPKTGVWSVHEGPVFGNFVLADEINRAPAKVQSALLEAMEERQVTVAAKTHKLPDLFLVLATQNPIEQEGTYPLPEAQMDRFLLYVRVDYPEGEDEAAILRLVRGEKAGESSESAPPLAQDVIFEARKAVHSIHVAEAAEKYIVDLVLATRRPDRLEGDLAKWIRLGSSPRGTLALDAAARAHAWIQGQDFVSPDNIRAVAPACLAHRIHLTYEAEAAGVTRTEVIESLLKCVVPV